VVRFKDDRDRQISIRRLRTCAGARRQRTAAVSGKRRRAAAISPVCLGFELGGSISSAGCTGAKHARRRTYLGRRGRLRRDYDGARCSGAAALLRRATHDDSGHGDVNKWHGWPPHLLARLRGSSSTVERRRQRRTATAMALGFRRGAAQAKAAARAQVGDPRGCDGSLNRPGEPPWRAGHTRGGVRVAGTSAESDSSLSLAQPRRRVGDDRWGPPVGVSGGGGERSGLVAVVGWLVGCCWAGCAGMLRWAAKAQASRGKLLEGRRRTSAVGLG
jgi:hypothetical protein